MELSHRLALRDCKLEQQKEAKQAVAVAAKQAKKACDRVKELESHVAVARNETRKARQELARVTASMASMVKVVKTMKLAKPTEPAPRRRLVREASAHLEKLLEEKVGRARVLEAETKVVNQVATTPTQHSDDAGSLGLATPKSKSESGPAAKMAATMTRQARQQAAP
jgi:hypothetical protein